jgi:hypothetical protein
MHLLFLLNKYPNTASNIIGDFTDSEFHIRDKNTVYELCCIYPDAVKVLHSAKNLNIETFNIRSLIAICDEFNELASEAKANIQQQVQVLLSKTGDAVEIQEQVKALFLKRSDNFAIIEMTKALIILDTKEGLPFWLQAYLYLFLPD